MLNRIMLSVTTALLLLLGSIGDGQAYTIYKYNGLGYPVKLYHPGSITMRAHAGSFPSGSPFRTALASTVTAWNDTPSRMVYTMLYDDTSVGLDNGQNEVWFQGPYKLPFGGGTYCMDAPAVTKLWYGYDLFGPIHIREADVLFSTCENYTTSQSKTSLWEYRDGGGSRPFQTTALHELGHVQGLGHTSNVYSIMGTDWTHIHVNSSVATAQVGEDAVVGSAFLYGYDAGREDVGVSHWRRTGASGEYSVHSRNRVFHHTFMELTKADNSVEPNYVVTSGKTIIVEVTLEHMGSLCTPHDVALVLSADDFILSGGLFGADQVLGMYRVSNCYDAPKTYYFLVTLPTGIPVLSRRWIGVVADYNNEVAEYAAANNATYIAQLTFW